MGQLVVLLYVISFVVWGIDLKNNGVLVLRLWILEMSLRGRSERNGPEWEVFGCCRYLDISLCVRLSFVCCSTE